MVHPWKSADRRPRGGAFSLIELLVVVAILVVLVAILVPSLSRARELAKTAECLSNMHQLGQAYLQYSTDSGYKLMPAAYRVWNDIGGKESYATLLVNRGYVSAPVQDPAKPESLGRSPFRCPAGLADKASSINPPSQTDDDGARFWRCTSTQSGKTIDTWYGINAATWYWDGLPARRIPNDLTGDVDPGSYLQIMRGASRVALLFDGVWMNVAQTNKPNRINIRHMYRSKINIMFCDGHANTYPGAVIPNDFDPIASSRIQPLANRDAFNQAHPEPRWVFGSDN